MASLRKVRDKWQAQIYVNGQRKSKMFISKVQAKNWARQKEIELESGGVEAQAEYALKDLLERYRREVTPEKKSAKTERNRIDLMCRELGDYKLSELQRSDIELWSKERLKEVKLTTVKRYNTVLSNALKYGRRWGWMTHNPMEDLVIKAKGQKQKTSRTRRISADEEELILLALGYDDRRPITTNKQRIAVAFLLALETAMRSGEMLKISQEDLNLEDGYVHLKAGYTKTEIERDVPLSNRAIELIEKLGPWPEYEPIFQLGDQSRDTQFRKAVRSTPIEDLTFHDTRHEAIWRLSKKLDVRDLARMTGHTDLNMLLRYYNPTAVEIKQQLDQPTR